MADIRSALESRLPATLSFLESLVRTNSFTANPDGVRANAHLISGQFQTLGFTAELFPCAVSNSGPHLLLARGPYDAPTIACVSHLDTVYPADEELRNNFTWLPEGDRIYGPGTCDIKGGTALMYLLLSGLADLDPALFNNTRWILLFNAAEEVLAPDFADLCLRTLPGSPRACLVFEADGESRGPNFSLVKARKGRGSFTVDVTGRGAHAGGRYADGANALHQLARLIDRAQSLTDLTKETTVNVGLAHGGTVTNRVPHHAQAQLEVRAFDQSHYQQVRSTLLNFAGPGDVRSPADHHPCHVRVTLTGESPAWPENPHTDALIRIWQRAASAAGHSLTAKPRGGLSDGNYLFPHFPTLDGLGPRGGNMHVSQRSGDGRPEFVEPASFVPKALVNYLAIRELLGHVPH